MSGPGPTEIVNDPQAEMIAWEYAKSRRDSGAGAPSAWELGEELRDYYDDRPGIDWTSIAVELLPLDSEID